MNQVDQLSPAPQSANIPKRLFTSQLMSLLRNSPSSSISHWTKKMQSLSKMSLRTRIWVRVDMKIGMGMMQLLMRMERPHNLCGLSQYIDYLSASTANNYCLESLTPIWHSWLGCSIPHWTHCGMLQYFMTYYDLVWLSTMCFHSYWHHPHSVLLHHSTASVMFFFLA